MSHYKKILGSQCYLSPPQAEDAEKWAQWLNDLEVTLPLGDEAYVPTTPGRESESIADMVARGDHVFSIVDLETELLIGRCLLFGLNWVDRTAMLGIVIGEKEYWDRGYGQEALALLLDYAFGLLNLHSVMLGTFEFNQRAIACYRRVGFREIGRRRQARIIAGRRYDVVLMDILAEEFRGGQVARVLASYAGGSP